MIADVLREAINLIKAGKKTEARDILEPFIVANPHNIQAWVWEIEACENENEKIRLMEACLLHNPGSSAINKALIDLKARQEYQNIQSATVSPFITETATVEEMPLSQLETSPLIEETVLPFDQEKEIKIEPVKEPAGAQLLETTLPCPHCGAMNKEGTRYCDSCGRSLAAETESSTEPAEEPVQSKKGKLSHFARILLFVFLMPVWCVVELRDGRVKKGIKILAGVILTIFTLILGLIIFWSFADNSSRASLVNWYQYLTGQSSELNPGNILRVNGSVLNPGTAEFSLIELQAKVYDEQGNLLGNSTQYIDSSLLSPGERFRFRLDVNSLLSSLNAGLSNQQVLQYDDFSDQSSGWANASFDEGETIYQAGQYHILVNKINYDVWSTSGREYGDVKIEVDATKLAGPESNRFGILCRYVDTDNYYFAVISSDGYYGIGKVVDGYQTFLHENGMLITDKVYSGLTLNHIRFDCVGTRLSLYINGDYVDAVDDSEFSIGDVGLLAGTFEKKGTKISFDNFVVINP